MSGAALLFLAVSVLALLLAPRRWAPLPLLAAACYMTLGQGVELGPATLTVVRLLIAAGVVRVLVRREGLVGGWQGLDWLMVGWAVWAFLTGVFHDPVGGALVFRLGLVYNACGVYFLIRVLCRGIDDAIALTRVIGLLLVPVAAAMCYEQVAGHNPFSIFGGVGDAPEVREGRLRASGPFAHPILAGTVGAVSAPLMIGLWLRHRTVACLGGLACVAMVVCSASSGPALSLLFGLGAVLLWPLRRFLRVLRWAAVLAYVALELSMNAPAYYLMARVDLVGGSTGWHRARLIESAIEHLDEWWLVGTDYTRHWMPTGLAVNPNHSDITNQYLSMGVLGGLPLIVLTLAILVKAFSYLGAILEDRSTFDAKERFMAWSVGVSLVVHATAFMSVSYFDQSVVFLYVTLALVGSLRAQGALASRAKLTRSPSRAAVWRARWNPALSR